jgi:hypothetical protein
MRIGWVAAGLVLAWIGSVRAEDILIPPRLERVPAEEIARRLGFLEERLDAGRRTAQAWQYGWTGIYATTLAVGVGQAIATDSGDTRLAAVVGAVKSAGALASLVAEPLPARLGADPLRAVPAEGRRGRLERLAVGERQLRLNVASAESRYSLRRHLEGVTTNLIGGAIIWAFGDPTDALVSTLSGIAVGEAQIWSQPWRATGDLEAYRAAFPTTLAERGVGWRVRPMPNGVQIAFSF